MVQRLNIFQINLLVFLSVFVFAQLAISAELEINNQERDVGGRVTFAVIINDTPDDIDSVEFNVLYDNHILSFEGWETGSLVSDFVFFNAAVIKGREGIIKVAGFTNSHIASGLSGEIVRLEFAVKECTNSLLELVDLSGAVEGFSTIQGHFKCSAE